MAFYNCTSLKSIEIPNSVNIIEDDAFRYCTALTSVVLPNSLSAIGRNAFASCNNISSLIITGEGEWLCTDLSSAILSSPKLYIDSRITSILGAKMPHSDVYCYSTTPPLCDNNSFRNYSGTLHVPSSSLASYFTAEYWSNFTNIVGDAVEPNVVSISKDSIQVSLGNQFNLTAYVIPNNATPNNITWTSTNTNIATVYNGVVNTVSVGECDIIAQCLNKKATCHLVVNDTTVTITLDQQEAMVLPNHILVLTPIPTPIVPELAASSSDPSVAAARVVNNKIQVVGIKEGTTTITVGSTDGTAIPATCLVTVYTESGDLDCDGFVNISDIALIIDYLLGSEESQISTKNADVDGDGMINIADVAELIDQLLNSSN